VEKDTTRTPYTWACWNAAMKSTEMRKRNYEIDYVNLPKGTNGFFHKAGVLLKTAFFPYWTRDDITDMDDNTADKKGHHDHGDSHHKKDHTHIGLEIHPNEQHLD